MLSILLGLVIGVGLTTQTSINAKLRQAFGSPFLASTISFTIGTFFLAIITLILDHRLFLSFAFIQNQPLWLWLGGVLGVVYLTGNILLFPKIGSVQTVIFPILGQVLMGLLIDNFGWFNGKISPFTWVRVLGTLGVVLGVLVTVVGPSWFQHALPGTKIHPQNLWIWRIFGIFTGMLSASQTAINGHLGEVVHSPRLSAFISFAIATVFLYLILLILRPKFSHQKVRQQNTWWMWTGGCIGALYVLGNAYLAPLIGTGLTVVVVLTGMITGSLFIDNFGWIQSPKRPISLIQILGLLIMALGIVVIRLL